MATLSLLGTARADELHIDQFPEELRGAARDISRVWKQHPHDPSVLYQVAALYARAGRKSEAMAALTRMDKTGAGLNPRPRDGFRGMADDPRFKALVDKIRAEHPPVLHATVAYTLEEGDLISEGIAWSERTRELYLGSVKRKIVAVATDGSVRQVVAPGTGGLGGVVGIRVDDARGELWAVSEIISEPLPGAVVGVFRFRLPDGALVRAYPIREDQADRINDLVVAPDGAVYVTSTDTGALLRIDPATNEVGTFLPAGSLPDPNGLTLDADGTALYVAGWHAITRVDLRTKARSLLGKPRGVADGCFDGLYRRGGDLVGVQNCVHEPGRIVRLRLSGDGRRIVKATVLESSNPLFQGITTGAIAGDRFFFVANTQFIKLGKGVPFDPVKILALPLAP